MVEERLSIQKFKITVSREKNYDKNDALRRKVLLSKLDNIHTQMHWKIQARDLLGEAVGLLRYYLKNFKET